MKRAAIAFRDLLATVIGGVGLEGAFLLTGTVCLAVFAWSINPFGPWLVAGVMFTLAGVALAVPARK